MGASAADSTDGAERGLANLFVRIPHQAPERLQGGTRGLANLPERKAVKEALRAVGLSDRQAQALLARGWAALVGESQAEVDEIREQLDAINVSIASRVDR